MSKNIVMNILADRPIAYHPDVARVAGSVKAGIFLSQLLYWSDKGKRGDGYIWKTQAEWEIETALTRYEQEGARKELKDRGLLEEKLQGIPARLYYKANTDVLYSLLTKFYLQTSMLENPILEEAKPPNSVKENPQTITESTQENTTKSTEATAAIFTAYENLAGGLTQPVSQRIDAALDEYPHDWILAAIEEAALSNGRNWKYIEAILKRWQREGRGNNRVNDSLWDSQVMEWVNGRSPFTELTQPVQEAIRQCGGDSIKFMNMYQLGETKKNFTRMLT